MSSFSSFGATPARNNNMLIVGIFVFVLVILAIASIMAYGWKYRGWFRSTAWEGEECKVDETDITKSDCDTDLVCSLDPKDDKGEKRICTKTEPESKTCTPASADTCGDFCNCPDASNVASAKTCAAGNFCPAAASPETCASGNFCSTKVNAESCKSFFPDCPTSAGGLLSFTPNKITLTENKYGCDAQTFVKAGKDPRGLPSWQGDNRVLKLESNGLFSCYPNLEDSGHYNNRIPQASPVLKYEM